MSDYISREAMSETPKCPGCGADMELMQMHLCNPAFYYACAKCGWDSPIGIDSESAFRMAMRRTEPKNRVLTLEELKAHKGFAWAECSPDIGSSSPVYVENGILFVDGDEINLNDNDFTYGEYERCWLRKPTETERWETPWAGDSRE